MGLDGAKVGLGGGAGGVTPGTKNKGSGGASASSAGNNALAFRRQKVANSKVGTGMAYEMLSKLQKAIC